ncbi:MAG: hypothetical protein K8R91_02660 [Phycisphaerae bacterium]|nr:hypothetical protein [Phycisphaerae bacterium]
MFVTAMRIFRQIVITYRLRYLFQTDPGGVPMEWNNSTFIVDFAMVALANLSNILLTGKFLSRPAGLEKLERHLVFFNSLLGLPVLALAFRNLGQNREWWTYLLPAVFVLFLLFELFIDTIFRLDFSQPWLLSSYRLLFYTSQLAMIGYALLMRELFGFITFITYFICLGANAYSYGKVGRGRGL